MENRERPNLSLLVVFLACSLCLHPYGLHGISAIFNTSNEFVTYGKSGPEVIHGREQILLFGTFSLLSSASVLGLAYAVWKKNLLMMWIFVVLCFATGSGACNASVKGIKRPANIGYNNREHKDAPPLALRST